MLKEALKFPGIKKVFRLRKSLNQNRASRQQQGSQSQENSLQSINKKQRIILFIVAVVIGWMLVFPPFHYNLRDGIEVGANYHLITDIPSKSGGYAKIDANTLITQWFGVIIIAGFLCLVFSYPDKKKPKVSKKESENQVDIIQTLDKCPSCNADVTEAQAVCGSCNKVLPYRD